MPTIGMPKVVKHTVRTCANVKIMAQFKMNKIKIIPLSIKHIGILMVLITSLFVLELYFFFMNLREGAADIVS